MEPHPISEPIPIIADVPASNPGLGFEEYAEAIAAAIRGGQPPQFTIGLYGSWGSGKSSLLNAISHALAREKNDVVPVYFDAWRYEKAEHIIVPILHAMHTAIRDSGDQKVADYLQRAIRSVIYSLNFSLRYIGGVELKPKDIRDNWQSEGLPALDEAFSRPFNELRSITHVLGHKRIVILIDDLDRCSSDKVVSVLESINLVMDVPGLIFVLALDYDILVRAITRKYPHVSGDAFIEKMVQLPFRVPPLNLERGNFLSALLPDFSTQVSDRVGIESVKELSPQLYDIATLGLEANPRQVKRLINSYLLLQRVVTSRSLAVDLRLLAALIGVQLGWPDFYQRFQREVMSEGEEDPLKVFTEAEGNPALVRYANRLLTENVPRSELRQLIQLTAVVATDQVTNLQQRIQEQVQASAEDFYVNSLGSFKAQVQNYRKHLEQNSEQLPEGDVKAQIQEMSDYYAKLESSIDHAAQDQGVQDLVNEAAEQTEQYMAKFAERAQDAGQAAQRGASENQPPNATQAARQKAQELGVDLSQIQGSGAEGYITVGDVFSASGLQQWHDEQYLQQARDFFGQTMGRIKGDMQSQSADLQSLMQQLPEDYATSQIQEMTNSYAQFENTIDQAAQHTGVQDSLEESAQQATQNADQAPGQGPTGV